jgi:tetratricopeptide (TPR) repeat protein
MNKLEKAYDHLKKRELVQAKVILEELLQGNHNEPEILYNLGMIYTELGDPQKAVETLSRLLVFEHCGSNVYVALGFAYSRMENYKKAKQMFLVALEMEPDNPYAHRNIGALYGKEGDHEKAILHLEEAFKLNPEDPNTSYGLGLSYFNIGEVSKADHYLRKTIEIEPNSSLAEIAKDLLREIATLRLKEKGFRIDAMFYCMHAINLFDKVGPAETQRISFEIGLKGRQGLDINNPAKQYTLDSLEGTFTGLQLVSYMYVGFKLIAPHKDIGIDLSEEYNMALNLNKSKGLHEYTIH